MSQPQRMTEATYAKSPFTIWGDPANREVYFPREDQLVPEAGAWAMITRQLPPLERRIDERFAVGRVFFVERMEGADQDGFIRDGTYKVQCRSPWGDLCLWPYEYSVLPVATVVELWHAGELIFHPLRIDSARLSEIAFYARSRGIGLADAAVMALGELSGNVGWFEPRADLAGPCEELARRVHAPAPGDVLLDGRRRLSLDALAKSAAKPPRRRRPRKPPRWFWGKP